jgi:hypothetical protein
VRGDRAIAAAQAAAGAGLIIALILPFSRGRLEATLVGHVLVQMPLLALAGWAFGSALEPRLDRVMEQWNRFGIAGFTFTIFTMLFWMVPRSVDSAIEYTGYEVFKFVSLPCAGAALALSFPRTLVLLAGALKANLVSMLGVLAWLYTAAPVRLCNSYLGIDQKMLGAGMALLAGALAVYWGLGLLFGSRNGASICHENDSP